MNHLWQESQRAFAIHNSFNQLKNELINVAQKSASTSQGACRSSNEPTEQYTTASQDILWKEM